MWCFEPAIAYGFTGGNLEAFNEGFIEPVVDVVGDVFGSAFNAVSQLNNLITSIDSPSTNSRASTGSRISVTGGGQPTQRASLMSNKKLDEIDLGFELEELERVKPFEPVEYNPRGMQAI